MPLGLNAADQKRKPWLWSGIRFGLNQLRIRSYLTALVLSCLVPVCLCSAYLVHYSYRNRIALLDQNLLATANILLVALDRHLAITQASLEALATSPALASGDMATFHAQARSVLKNFPDSDIILADETGQQIVNSYEPFGSALPKRNPHDTVFSIFETGRPRISNLFKGAVTGRYLIGVDVPVFQDTRIRYDLGMTLPADYLLALFRLPELPREWLITILDSDNAVVARSNLQDAYTGKHIESPPLLQLMAAANSGTTEGVNLEGALSMVSFRRSDVTRWTVLVSMPKAVMANELGHWLLLMIASLSVLVVFGLALALVIARIITRSVQDLIAPALALGRGETMSVGQFQLVETSEVANALSRAADLLRKHEAARERAHGLWQEAEKTLRSNMARLELVNAELQEFAFVAAHDLQEPLRKIITFCDMVNTRSAPVLDSTSHDYLDRVISSASHMRQLLRDLLEFSRAAAKPEPFKKIDLVKVVREAADLLELSIKETDSEIEVENMPAIEADESQMLWLFRHLMGNALKFRGDETPRIKIYGKLHRRGMCELFVKDNGIGFDAQFAELIFKPFQRLHRRSEYDGTGMGLAICRKIVERHGGNIRAESEPGKGSTFIIRLPVKHYQLDDR
jgi:signal transduction histidine kinase